MTRKIEGAFTEQNLAQLAAAAKIKPLFTPEQEARMVEAFAAFGRAMRQRAAAFIENVAVPIHRAMWQAYRAAGMPYGDTEDGLLRWMRERQRAQGLRDEADRIEAIHATCAQLRAKR